MGAKISRGALVATLVGNTLEFYDFVTYTFLAVYVGRAFFPTDSAFASLLLSVATFGIGFLTRPLGAIWIGAYADRVGRKPALLVTIALMSVGTLGLVATPSYASIGVAAPLILVVSRLVQGLALGGEVGPASAVLLECAPPGQRALYISLQSMSQGVAMLVAGIVGVVVTQLLDPAAVAAWGWRVPFAVGLVLVPIGFYIRRALPETLPEPEHASAAAALRAVWDRHRRAVVLIVLVTACSTVTTYVGSYMTTYAQVTLGLPATIAMAAPITLGVSTFVAAPVAGIMCERFGRHRSLFVSRFLTIALQVPMFAYLNWARSLAALVVVIVVGSVVGAPASVSALTVMAEIFPAHTRSAGIALSYALTVTIFGATTQFAIAWLIGVTGSPMAPAYYVMGMAALSIVAMSALPVAEGERRLARA